MAYASWSVVFGEQPSAAKWNILGTNDAYFDSLIGSGTAWTAYTPTITAVGGTFTSVAATGRWQQFGKIAHVSIVVTVTTLGTATGATLATLPVNAVATNSFVGTGRGDVVSGALFQGRLNSASQVAIYKYDGTMGQANTEVTRCLFIYETA